VKLILLDGKRRRRIAAIVLIAAAGSLAATPLPPAWKNWLYSRAIELSPADTPRLSSVTITEELYPKSRAGLSDLRVIDDLGAETPYVVFRREGSKTTAPVSTTVHEKSFAPGLYTQLILEISGRAPFHNAVQIKTSETDFIEWVQVEASDDAHVWRIVQQRAPIFRFQKDHLQGTQTVSYSENNANFLRVRILDGAKQFPIAGASVLHETTEAPERVALPIAMIPDAKGKPDRTTWIVDLGDVAIPVSELRFEVAAPAEFIRSVVVSTSSDKSEWPTLVYGEIYRYRLGETVQEQLSLRLNSSLAHGRYWRVEIVNRNDAPLAGAIPHLYATPAHIVFEQQPGRSYRLLYGQSEAKRPEYDLVRRLDAKQMTAAVAATLGPEEVNPGWSDPQPWTEQHSVFLWVVLGIAVIILAATAIQSLRRSASPQP